jgi:hypothetical protein
MTREANSPKVLEWRLLVSMADELTYADESIRKQGAISSCG